MQIIFLPVNGHDVAHLVERAEPVSMPTEREQGGKTVYGETGYVAVHARVATSEEISEWRRV